MKKTLVIGASLNPDRYSNLAINRLLEKNIETEAIGLKSGMVNGLQISSNLRDLKNIHTITLYIRATNQPQYYDYILKLNPKRVIFNPGTENIELYKLLKDNDIAIEVGCTLVMLATNQY